MIDIISLVNSVIGIIEKTHNLLRGIRGKSRSHSERIRKEARNLLEEVSQLIYKFSESVDLILKMLEELYPSGNYYGQRVVSTARLFKANRRLFEISSEMRILAKSISKKFPGVEISEIKKVTDLCLQIVYIEDFVGVQLATSSQFNRLPLKPSENNFLAMVHDGFMQRMKTLPFNDSPGIDGYIKKQFAYFNNLLLKLTECKERLATALQELI